MRDQFFGDQTDYAKYGMLRAIASGSGPEIAVHWWKTGGEGLAGGTRTGYLRQRAEWRRHDPALYSMLAGAVGSGRRSTREAEEMRIVPRARYWSSIVLSDPDNRKRDLAAFLLFARGAGLVYLDPDNGIEVPSVPAGSERSRHYVYWWEVRALVMAGHSVIVYQHLPRRPRGPFIESRLEALRGMGEGVAAGAVRTPDVAFLLAVQPDHVPAMESALGRVTERWAGRLRVSGLVAAPVRTLRQAVLGGFV